VKSIADVTTEFIIIANEEYYEEKILSKENDAMLSVQLSQLSVVPELRRDGAIELIRVEVTKEQQETNESKQKIWRAREFDDVSTYIINISFNTQQHDASEMVNIVQSSQSEVAELRRDGSSEQIRVEVPE